MHKILISIGSNYQSDRSLPAAMKSIAIAFDDVRFSTVLLTNPIGCTGNCTKYHNAVALANTSGSVDKVVGILKHIESCCGDNTELRNDGKVAMDLDLLLYDDTVYHHSDWQRPYILQLTAELGYGNAADAAL